MPEPLVEFDQVEKIYRLGAERMNIRAALPGRLGRRAPTNGHAALSGVSLTLSSGESLGIVGSNGAGKSTLLKIVARIVAPTRGSVTTRGSIASLIELGAGFHPDLTGAENVRFAAVLLGMDRIEVSRRYDEIVEFAGIEKFMGTPIKRYSSGMLARLGFAVASHLDAEILAVDEVLSVGDVEFRERCFDRMNTLRGSGCALLFVTHNLWVVPQVCQHAIHLDHGRIADEGNPEDVVARYRARSLQQAQPHRPAGERRASVESLSINPSGIQPGEDVAVESTVNVLQPLTNSRVLVGLERADGLLCAGVDVPGSEEALLKPGLYHLKGYLRSLPLLPGSYNLWLSIVEQRSGPIVHDQARVDMAVIGDPRPTSIYGVVDLDSNWSFESPTHRTNT